MNGQLSFGVQNWQNEFVDALPIEQWLTDIEHSTKDYFMTGEQGREELKDLLEEQFIHYLEYCRSYPEIKEWLDEQIRRAFNVILEHEHSLIAVASETSCPASIKIGSTSSWKVRSAKTWPGFVSMVLSSALHRPLRFWRFENLSVYPRAVPAGPLSVIRFSGIARFALCPSF